MKLPVREVPVVSLNVAIARGTLNAPASAMGVTAITMIAIGITASMSFFLDFAFAGAAIFLFNPYDENDRVLDFVLIPEVKGTKPFGK